MKFPIVCKVCKRRFGQPRPSTCRCWNGLGLGALLLLAGCATPPPATPTVADITARYQSLHGAGVPPVSYMTIGTTLESQQCNAWFSSQIAGAQKTNLAMGLLGLGAGAAGVASAPVGAPAAMGLLSALLANNQANSAAGGDPVGTYILMNRTLQAWQAAVQNPQSIEDADAFVESYAELCQLPGIQAAVRMAVVTAPVTTTQPTPTLSARGFAPQRPLPPVVVVGTPQPVTAPMLEVTQDDPPAVVHRRHSVKQRYPSPPSDDEDILDKEWRAIQRAGGRNAYEQSLIHR